MNFKNEIEKITGLKLKGENTWESLEENNSIGFEVKTDKSQKIVHDTEKLLHLKIRIINKTTIKILQAKNMECMNIVGKIAEDKKTQLCFHGTLGGYYVPKTNTYYEEKPDGDYKIIQTDVQGYEEELREYYERCKKDFEELEDVTKIKGKEILYSPINMARQLAYERFKYLHGSERLNDEEWEILEGSMQGGHMWYNRTEIENCTQYDMNNMYAYAMNNKGFKFPMRSGKYATFKTLDEIEGLFGLFELDVENPNEQTFKKTKNSYYTHYDIKRLKRLNIPFKLVQRKFNAYIYDDDAMINSNEFFGYMKELYEYKLKGNKEVKLINSRTWGVLSQPKTFDVPLEHLEENNICGSRVVKYDIERGTATIKAPEDNPCKYTTARLKTFLLSYCKYIFMNRIQDVIDEGFEVYKINTDGFVSNIPEEKMNELYLVNKAMGCLKVEKEYAGRWRVVNIRTVEKIA